VTPTKLCQIVAVQKGLQVRTSHAVTEIYHGLQKPPLFSGISRTYQPVDDDGTRLPPEYTLVQKNVESMLADAAGHLTALFDVVATKETANMSAKAAVVLDGQRITPELPVPFLLFLEKQLVDLRTVVSKAPVLDPADRWTEDRENGGYATAPVKTLKTQKITEVLVKYAATDKHPAQTEVVTVDKPAGYWETVKFSGALPRSRRDELVARIDAMSDAVKRAREEANSMEVEQIEVGKNLFLHLLG